MEAAGQKVQLSYGVEPGIRFALLLDGNGGCREISSTGLRKWKPADGILWVHLERDHDAAAAWVADNGGFDPLVADALLEDESLSLIHI